MSVPFADRWTISLSFLLALALLASGQQPSSNTMNDSGAVGFLLQQGSLANVSMNCFGQGTQYSSIISMCTKPAGGIVITSAAGSCRYGQGLGSMESFGTEFTFVMAPGNSDYENQGGLIHHYENLDGMALVISDSPEFAFRGASGGYLGLEFPKPPSNQSTYNYSVLAVEFDVFPNPEFGDPLYDHVGIDVHGMNSSHTAMAGYHIETTPCSGNYTFVPMNLSGVGQIQAWVDYIGGNQPHLLVSMSPKLGIKPPIPLLNASLDPSTVAFLQRSSEIYVGMSASEGIGRLAGLAYVLNWSFNTSGPPVELFPGRTKPSSCPVVKKKDHSKLLILIVIPVSLTAMLILGGIIFLLRSIKRLHKEFEHTLQDYRPVKFCLKDLKLATLGFSEDRALGRGGYGTVYKGILADDTIVAVKKFSSKNQADRDAASSSFVQESKVIGRLRHVNLVRLLGWCQEKGELMLVYEFMPNASLDYYLFSKGQSPSEIILSWDQRFQILKGVARALAYLHDEWRELVVHRDVKISNVLLDAELNSRLGDFGLARLYDRKEAWNPKTTNVAGTHGYIAPEVFLNSKFTDKSDVYAFGMVALQVVSGRKIYDPALQAEEQELLEWIYFMLNSGRIMEVADGRLGEKYERKQVLDVIQIGLCCTNYDPNQRPRMRQILEMLEGEALIPEPQLLQSSPQEVSILPVSNVDEDEETPLRDAEFGISTTFSGLATTSLAR
ncbi:hypothetical protein O6H91_01G147100 [Diphasiastrum complanatum]|uniref:Uncharacterized protein n=3 Tax=Diphasiastrum complanatum TaxID=34168 RepID=A0ACC2EX43_DIPCM|nr:hypothetical protein O6H91_01G147100 [Diphasiastrum complanatum]